MKASAAEVYLVEQWDQHTGPARERRNKIFQNFIELGMRERWKYHALASDTEFTDKEKDILQKCRTWEERALADWVGEDLKRVLFTTGKLQLSDEQLEWCTGWGRENERLVCGDIDALPERIYSMSAFDDPDDVAEARQVHDQSLWVSGVYWVADEELKIVWVDEFGQTIREKRCELNELQEGAEAFDRYEPFESSWWTEATKVGKYASGDWWS